MVHLKVIQGEAATEEELAFADSIRPRTRGECAGGMRPCPHVGCRHHLLLHVGKDGHLKAGGRKKRPTDDEILERLFSMKETCSLDVADSVAGGTMNRRAVGELMGLSRERVRHLERIESAGCLIAGFKEWFGEERPIVRNEDGTMVHKTKPLPEGRYTYPTEVREEAVRIYGETKERKDAEEYIQKMTGRTPSKNLFYSWVSNKRKYGRVSRGKRDSSHFINEGQLERVWEYKKRGHTHAEIAGLMAGSYGRRPYLGTVSNWVRRAKELFGESHGRP